MASIQKVAKGWRVQVMVDGQRDSRTFDTRAAAMAWSAQRETELRSIASGAGSKTLTVGDVLKEYELKVTPTKRGARWERLRLPLIGSKEIGGRKFKDIKLTDLRPSHIAAWRDVRLREVSGASTSREMSLMSHAFLVARKEWGWLVTNPMADVKRPPDSPGRERLISQEEIELLLASLGYEEGLPVETPMQRVAVAFLFAIETAMRSSEILTLTASSVNYKGKFARLPMTKNGTARNVPLSSRAMELLKMLPDVPKGESLFALSASSRDALFRKARDRSQIPDVTFHDTRHEAITRLAKKLQPLDLARMTGHRNISELMTYYNATATDIAGRLG
ncbi:site-specific integrase [Pandoraea apista]|uniref:Site-specific integrase n=2 Tax=Pandoraea TaxID=93217 RepID=A0ABX9ZNA7_9BURK|nr:site-specific integrase [Pandoraea apista]PTD98626.1 site-specific integrase [Pandoraea apista]RRJ26310.1 site-specific integrase [Pandoraea apista]RRJ79765.1 site-specific integrase [Pandoraea apista]RSC97792.1 site-specific integrase [Pandoraea apista]RSD17613.1 site-specific integrase [Pandoraea apista]